MEIAADMASFGLRGDGRVRAVRLGLCLAAAAACAGPALARDQIRIVGSSTVFPFTTAVAENFRRVFPQFRPPIVESTGTGGGLKLFCEGIGARTPDIANASRRIKASEVADCNRNGVKQIIEIQVGIDGLVLAQAKTARFIALTQADVYAGLAATPFGKPQRARSWVQVNAALPPLRIEVIGPPPTSGTRDAFNELYMRAGCDTSPAMRALAKTDKEAHARTCEKVREDGAFIEAGENDNLIVQKLVSNPLAIGVFGFSYFEENRDKLRDVPINGVVATYETIADGRYPGARPMFIYVKGEHVRAVRGLREFLIEYTRNSTAGPRGYLARRGLIPLPEAERLHYQRVARELIPLAPGAVS
jgi:phosphate transport system substrate-binding protein